MSEPARGPFVEALAALAGALEASGADWMIIGGVAVIALGVPRATLDVDATVSGEHTDLDRLAGVLSRHAIEPRLPDALEFARKRQVLLLRHTPTGVNVDISLAWLPFEKQALAASREQHFEGVRLKLPRPDDLLVFKLVASRPRDLDDAERLLLLHGSDVDLKRTRSILAEFCAVLEDEARLRAFDELVKRAGLDR